MRVDRMVFSPAKRGRGSSRRALEEIVWRDRKLFAKLSKCDFWLEKVQFLGHVISKDGVAVDPSKVELVMEW